MHVTGRTGTLTLEADLIKNNKAVVNACTVRRGARIGMNATVLDNADVGASALVAAGAVVLNGRGIPPATLFFQAEDGIRGTSVTGVQTCALPICALQNHENGPGAGRARDDRGHH